MAWILTLKVSSHSSSEISSIDLKVAWCAALLTKMPTPPNSFTHFSTMTRQCCDDWMSPATSTALRPASSIQRLVSFRVVVLVEIRDEDVCAFASVGDRYGPPDAFSWNPMLTPWAAGVAAT